MGDGAAAVNGVSEPPPRTSRGKGRRLHGAIAHKIGTAILSGEIFGRGSANGNSRLS